MSGSLVSSATRQRVRDLATPIATGLGRLGLTPNALTLIGFVGTCIGAYAAATQAWMLAGALVLAFGIFDLFDGTLARATGTVSRFGAFLDSTFDRAGEAIVFVGIAIGCLAGGYPDGAIYSIAALAASSLVPYTRAKAESLGFGTGPGLSAVGLMPREVRLVVLSLGLLLAPDPIAVVRAPGVVCIDYCAESGGLLWVSLLAITIGAVLTTIQRILHVRAQSREG